MRKIIQKHNNKGYEIQIPPATAEEPFFSVWEPSVYSSGEDLFELSLWPYKHPLHGSSLSIKYIDAHKFRGEGVSYWLLPLACQETSLPIYSTGLSARTQTKGEVRISNEAVDMWKNLMHNTPTGFMCGLDATVNRYYLIDTLNYYSIA